MDHSEVEVANNMALTICDPHLPIGTVQFGRGPPDKLSNEHGSICEPMSNRAQRAIATGPVRQRQTSYRTVPQTSSHAASSGVPHVG